MLVIVLVLCGRSTGVGLCVISEYNTWGKVHSWWVALCMDIILWLAIA